MENAVKGLLVAATVLVAILVISLGMVIFNMSSSTANSMDKLDELELIKYNKQYEGYEGIHYGSAVKTLLGYAMSNNETLYQDDKDIKYCVCIRSNDKDILNNFKNDNDITIGLNGTRNFGVKIPSNISNIRKAVNSQKKYKIWFSYNDLGYIWEIHIDEP